MNAVEKLQTDRERHAKVSANAQDACVLLQATCGLGETCIRVSLYDLKYLHIYGLVSACPALRDHQHSCPVSCLAPQALVAAASHTALLREQLERAHILDDVKEQDAFGAHARSLVWFGAVCEAALLSSLRLPRPALTRHVYECTSWWTVGEVLRRPTFDDGAGMSLAPADTARAGPSATLLEVIKHHRTMEAEAKKLSLQKERQALAVMAAELDKLEGERQLAVCSRAWWQPAGEESRNQPLMS